MVCDLIGGLRVQGVESLLCCTDEQGELYDGAQAAVKFCGHRRPGLFIIDWKLVRQLCRIVRDNKVTVIHAHNPVAHLHAVGVSWFTGIPVVATWHGQGYTDTARVRFLKRLLSKRSRNVIIVSEDSKRVAVENGAVSEGGALVIPNGVDTRKFVPAGSETMALRERLGIPPDAVVIGSAGRLSTEKNYPLLVRSFAQVAQKKTLDLRPETIDRCEALGGRTSCEPSSAHGSDKPRPPKERSFSDEDRSNVYRLRFKVSPFLLLIGDGPDRARIEDEIQRQGVTGLCRITGMQSEVLPWLQAMDIFCLSSDSEGLSISLLEAGACGLPCVVTDAGGNREIVKDGVSGLVVPIGDEAALAKGLERLVEDPELRRKMGATAREAVEKHFSLNAMVDGYVKVYEKAR